jgi:hypothetical protein
MRSKKRIFLLIVCLSSVVGAPRNTLASPTECQEAISEYNSAIDLFGALAARIAGDVIDPMG